MPIIPDTILRATIETGPVLAPLSLWIWSRAFRSAKALEIDRHAPILGTRIDGVKHAAEILGAPPGTVARHWPRFRELFERDDRGLWYPKSDAWPSFEDWTRTAAGFPRYLKIGGKAIRRIVKLSSLGKAGFSAQRLALSLVSPCLAKKRNGDESAPMSSRMVEAWLGMSRKSQKRAIDNLRKARLLSLEEGAPYRRALLSSFLFCDTSTHAQAAPPRVIHKKIHNLWKTQTADRANRNRPPYIKGRIERDLKQLHREPVARFFLSVTKCEAFGDESATDPVFPELSLEAARAFASVCDCEAAAMSWIRQEKAGILSARNPAGYFVHLSRRGSRPGNRSKLEQALVDGVDLSSWNKAPRDPADFRGLSLSEKYLEAAVYLPGERESLESRAAAIRARKAERLTDNEKAENARIGLEAWEKAARSGLARGELSALWLARRRGELESLQKTAAESPELLSARAFFAELEKMPEACASFSCYDLEIQRSELQKLESSIPKISKPAKTEQNRKAAAAFFQRMGSL